jgi:lipopolysaccharide export system permease protein
VEDGLRNSLKFEDGYSYSKKEEDEFMTVQFSKLSIMDSPLITKEKEFNSRTEGNGSALIWSISICLMTILSIFIAVPISKISPRKGRYSRVLPGLLVFSTYTALLLSFKGNEMIELTSLLIVHFLFLLLALVLNLFFLRSIK